MTTTLGKGKGNGGRKRPRARAAEPSGATAAASSASGGSAGPAPNKKASKSNSCIGGGVTIVHAPATAEPISHEAPDVFARLLGPLTVEAFMANHYGPKRPLVVRGHDFGPLLEEGMEGGEAEALLEATPSETISVWTVDESGSGKISTARVQDPGSAAALWRAGHSVYCRAPEPVERALVDAAVRLLGLGFRTSEEGVKAVVEGEVELFMGRKGHRTPFHFDFQENWTLQLAGRKRWRLVPGVDNPVRGCTPHYAQAEGVLDAAAEEQLKVHRIRDASFRYGPPLGSSAHAAMEVVLQPGDLFYHPAGVWHAVDCVGEEDSVSINISLDGLTYADHIAGALRQALMTDPTGRFTAMVQTGGAPQASLEHMAGLLCEAAKRLEGLAAAPAALLPPCVLWGQPLPPLEPAEKEDEDDGEDGEGEGMILVGESEEGSEARNGSVEEEVEVEEVEEADEDEHEEGDLGASFPHPVAPTAALRRNPLAALFALDDTNPDDNDDEDGGDKEGTEAFMVHFAYGAGEDLSSLLRKKVVLDAKLGRFVGRQPVGEPFLPSATPGGETTEGLRALGALVHLGVLVV